MNSYPGTLKIRFPPRPEKSSILQLGTPELSDSAVHTWAFVFIIMYM